MAGKSPLPRHEVLTVVRRALSPRPFPARFANVFARAASHERISSRSLLLPYRQMMDGHGKVKK
jgi:hypothetical protein